MIFALFEHFNRDRSVNDINPVVVRRTIQGNSGNIGAVSESRGAKFEIVVPDGVIRFTLPCAEETSAEKYSDEGRKERFP